MKKILIIVSAWFLLIVGFWLSRYYSLVFVSLPSEGVALGNGIVIEGMMIEQQELNMLKSIDKNIFTSQNNEIPISLNASVVLLDESIAYEYVNLKNNQNNLFIRSKGKPIWTLSNTKDIYCCFTHVLNFNNIDNYIIPTKVIDVVLIDSGSIIILQGTGGERIEQVKRGP